MPERSQPPHCRRAPCARKIAHRVSSYRFIAHGVSSYRFIAHRVSSYRFIAHGVSSYSFIAHGVSSYKIGYVTRRACTLELRGLLTLPKSLHG